MVLLNQLLQPLVPPPLLILKGSKGPERPLEDTPARLRGARARGFPKDRFKKVQRCADKPRVYAKRSEEKVCEASRRPLRIYTAAPQ
jgi:hypothetical protein